jgi:hypothetical protein
MSSMAIDHFIRFCVDANIDRRNIADSVRKYMLAYQHNILHKGAFAALFESATEPGKATPSFINWEHIERKLPRLDCAHWIAMFKYIDFSPVPCDKSVLQNIDRHLRTLSLESHSLACQVFLLKNTNFITSQLGVERLMCECDIPDAYTKSLQFFALCTDAAFDITETTAVFCHIMQKCQIHEAEIEKQIQFVSLRGDELSTT